MEKENNQRTDTQKSNYQTNLTEAEINKIASAAAIILENKQKEEKEKKMRARKNIRRLFFGKLKDIKAENGAFLFMQLVVAGRCKIIKIIGYILAIITMIASFLLLFVKGLWQNKIAWCFAGIAMATVIWIYSRLMGLAGIEIEETNDKETLNSFSAFILTTTGNLLNIIALIVAIATLYVTINSIVVHDAF